MKQTIVCCLLAAIGVLTVSAQGIYDIKVKDGTDIFYQSAKLESLCYMKKASPVYELLGYKGVGTDLFPGMDNGLMEGRLTYRQHHGGHEAGPNWPFFLDFFEREVLRK